jgi:hypothetical protein
MGRECSTNGEKMDAYRTEFLNLWSSMMGQVVRKQTSIKLKTFQAYNHENDLPLLSFQVTVGLKCNSVILVWSDPGSRFQ